MEVRERKYINVVPKLKTFTIREFLFLSSSSFVIRTETIGYLQAHHLTIPSDLVSKNYAIHNARLIEERMVWRMSNLL